ncbi:MAG TPA: pseudouridine synthase [Rectinemataceae bacterium]|nr:pseudouridine synthase [Rectinemataceae bacterium]
MFGSEIRDGTEPRVVVADDAIVVVWKPHRMHCAELEGDGGQSLSAWVFGHFPETAPSAFPPETGARGADGGLIHRLDFETAGLVLFARSPEARAAVRKSQEDDRIRKTYRLGFVVVGEGLTGSSPLKGVPEGLDEAAWAACLDEPRALAETLGGATVRSRFRPYGPRGSKVACLGAPATSGKGRGRGSPDRFYRSSVLAVETRDGAFAATVELTRGFRHQIRAHFAWIGLPLLGDFLYGGGPGPRLDLVATGLAFEHPTTGLAVTVGDVGDPAAAGASIAHPPSLA